MTDPIADLRRDLVEAARRDIERPRRFAFALPRVNLRPALAFAVTAAACIAALLAIGTVFGGGTDAERAADASDPTPKYPQVCVSELGRADRVLGPVPGVLRERFGVLRRPAGRGLEAMSDIVPRLPQVGGVYEDGHRFAAFVDGRRYAVLAAAVVSRKALQITRDGDPAGDVPQCQEGGVLTTPGMCLIAEDDGGQISACYTLREIETADGFLDLSRRDEPFFAGIAPDGVGHAVLEATKDAAKVQDNVFAGYATTGGAAVLEGGEAAIRFDLGEQPRDLETCAAPAEGGEIPDLITETFDVFRGPPDPDAEVASSQITRLYDEHTRDLGKVGVNEFAVIAAEVRSLDEMGGSTGCERLALVPSAPGVCLYARADQEDPSALTCWTVEELEAEPHTVELADDSLVAGVAPDGVKRVDLVQDNSTSKYDVGPEGFFAGDWNGEPYEIHYVR